MLLRDTDRQTQEHTCLPAVEIPLCVPKAQLKSQSNYLYNHPLGRSALTSSVFLPHTCDSKRALTSQRVTHTDHTHTLLYMVENKVNVLVTQLCPTLCNTMDCSSSGSSVHGILQPRVLEWVAIPFCRGSSRPRD